MGLIDTHAHVTCNELHQQVEDVLSRCDEAGVDEMITIGTDLDDTRNALALAKKFPARIHAAGAFHPHEAGKVADDAFETLRHLWSDPDVVAVGEMGLDYHYDFAPRSVQRTVFARQLELAKPLGKPVIIHCREAFEDLVPLLIEQGFENDRVVFHCFTGTTEEAALVHRHGWRISFTGVVTFKRSIDLQRIAKTYPVDMLMIESDSPYLSPEPVRSKRPNEPAHIAHIAAFLARLREVPYDALADQVTRNAREFFRLELG